MIYLTAFIIVLTFIMIFLENRKQTANFKEAMNMTIKMSEQTNIHSETIERFLALKEQQMLAEKDNRILLESIKQNIQDLEDRVMADMSVDPVKLINDMEVMKKLDEMGSFEVRDVE